MNIFLIGNGFDLHHKFPTRYIDFLHTVHFLVQNKDDEFVTVGDVFSNDSLQETDIFIKDAYEKHGEIFIRVVYCTNFCKSNSRSYKF